MRPMLILALGILATIPPSTARAAHLARDVVPVHYALHLTPDLARGRFSGRVTIDLEVRQATDTITLHAVDLHLTRSVLRVGAEARIPRVTADATAETLTLRFAAPLAPGTAQLDMAWEAALDRELRGFYLAGSGDERFVATQLQATDARRVFPSFDEPDLKARFTLSTTIPAGLTAIANMPVESTREDGTTRTLRFATTPLLPTYLVALTVGAFDCLEDTHGRVPLRVCALGGRATHGAFALAATRQALTWFEDYYGMAMPFPKLDQVALPEFAWSAMENPGAIFYAEDALLADPAMSSPAAQGYVEVVVAHEIAHLWFGDYVTMRWWDDVWLNEGFASWLETRPHAAGGDPERLALAELEGVAWAFHSDVLRNARPMRNRVGTPEEIQAAFDDVAYQKSAAVLRMLEGWVGPARFRDAIRTYLADHAWANTDAADFGAALSTATEQPVAGVLDSFVHQPGLPVIELRARCRGAETEVRLAQRRFLLDSTGDRSTWRVPVCLRTRAGEHCELLDTPRRTLRLPGCDDLLMGNAGGRGYYLVDHAPAQRAAFAADLDALAPTERETLLRDEWWLVRAARRPIAEYLAIVRAVRADTEVEGLLERLDEIERILLQGAADPGFAALVREVLDPALARAEARADDDAARAWRARLRSALARHAADADSLATAAAFHTAWATDPVAADPAEARHLLRVGAWTGAADLHAALLARLTVSEDAAERYDLIDVLSNYREPALVARQLAATLDDTLRAHEVSTLLSGMLRQPGAGPLTWAFLRREWPALQARLPPGHAVYLVRGAAALCDRARAAELQDFLTAHPDAATPAEGARAVDEMRGCATLRAAQARSLADFLTGLAGQPAGD